MITKKLKREEKLFYNKYINQQALILEVNKNINPNELLTFNVLKDSDLIKANNNYIELAHTPFGFLYESDYKDTIEIVKVVEGRQESIYGDIYMPSQNHNISYTGERIEINTSLDGRIKSIDTSIRLDINVNILQNINISFQLVRGEIHSMEENIDWDDVYFYQSSSWISVYYFYNFFLGINIDLINNFREYYFLYDSQMEDLILIAINSYYSPWGRYFFKSIYVDDIDGNYHYHDIFDYEPHIDVIDEINSDKKPIFFIDHLQFFRLRAKNTIPKGTILKFKYL